MTHVTEVLGMEGDIITLQAIFRYDYALGRPISTGIRPAFSDRLRERGTDVPAMLFGDVA